MKTACNFLRGRPATEKTFNRRRNMKSCKTFGRGGNQVNDIGFKTKIQNLIFHSKRNGRFDLDFNLNFTKPKQKRRPYTAIRGRVKHYQPDGTGRDIYVFDNHGGLTLGNKCVSKHASARYKGTLRAVNSQAQKVGVMP